MSRSPFYTNIHFLIVAGGMVLNSLLAVVYRYINSGSPFVPLHEWAGFYGQGWPIMAQTFVILYFLHYTIRHFNQRYQTAPNSTGRFIRELLVVLLAGFGIMEFFHWIFITFMVVPEADMNFLDKRLKMIQTIDIAFLIVLYALFTSMRIFRYLQQKNSELLQWQREYAQSQFETIKNQLNPHFLFNSLNALSSLVWVDADRAELFIEKLSRSYRYLLEQKDRQLVPLHNELQFLQSFVFLLQERFGNKLQVQMQQLSPEGKQLPPHSLMIVFDYLLATNGMSSAHPLRIELKEQAGLLAILYNCQPKTTDNPTAPLQLQRLKEQFTLKGKELTVQESTAAQGLIQLPLF